MNKRQLLIVTGSLVTVSLLAAVTLAASVADFGLWWHVIPSGGGHSSSADYALDGSAGQPAVGALGSASYRLGTGYWYGMAAPAPPPGYKIYLPIVLKSYP